MWLEESREINIALNEHLRRDYGNDIFVKFFSLLSGRIEGGGENEHSFPTHLFVLLNSEGIIHLED